MANFRTFAVATISGLVATDPETQTFQNGNSIVSFKVPVNNGYKDKNGEWVDRTSWYSVKCNGYIADSVVEHVSKGTVVTVHGKLTINQYTNQHGVQVTNVEIMATDISFGARFPNVTADSVPETNTRTASLISPSAATRISNPNPSLTDDIPF